MNFKLNNIIFINNINFILNRLYRKLDFKKFDSFKIIEFIEFFYRLELPLIIRIYNIFYINYFILALNDLLLD